MASISITDTGTPIVPAVPRPRGSHRLESGDHMDRATFHERYRAMPPEFHAELIDGVVFVSSPTSLLHGRPHNLVGTLLGVYEAYTPGTQAYNNTTVYPDENSEVQPDNMLILPPELGGRLHQEGGYFAGGPEFVGEVAYSSESYDLHSKLRIYERAGVLEYFVLLVREQQAVFFIRQDERFQPQAAIEGAFRSQAFPGLWLDEAAMRSGDSAGVLATLQRGLATPEHADFVKRLQTAHP